MEKSDSYFCDRTQKFGMALIVDCRGLSVHTGLPTTENIHFFVFFFFVFFFWVFFWFFFFWPLYVCFFFPTLWGGFLDSFRFLIFGCFSKGFQFVCVFANCVTTRTCTHKVGSNSYGSLSSTPPTLPPPSPHSALCANTQTRKDEEETKYWNARKFYEYNFLIFFCI